MIDLTPRQPDASDPNVVQIFEVFKEEDANGVPVVAVANLAPALRAIGQNPSEKDLEDVHFACG